MQALFLMWCGRELVRVDCLRVISGADLSATAHALMREVWSCGSMTTDHCVIYLVKDRKLTLVGEETYVGS